MVVMKKFVAISSSCLLFLFAYLAIGIDDWLGASRSVLFELAFVLLGMIFGAFAFAIGKHKAFLLAPSFYVLFILALPFLELSPVKPAVRAVHEIRRGMSEAQVRAVLDRHFPEQDHFKRPAMVRCIKIASPSCSTGLMAGTMLLSFRSNSLRASACLPSFFQTEP